ncbi:MAG: Flp pilus assembly protein CpaB [Planctomycetes bacterium]|nr:Flp pilus assembly protein CpaB [Planctomycetota bacterium]
MKSKVALLIAIVLGVLAALAVRQYVTQKEVAIYEGKKPVEIIVARREIHEGEALTGPSIEAKQFPKDYLPPDSISWSDHSMTIGRKVSRLVKRGDPIQWADLIEKEEEKETGMQSRLAIEERAITLSVTRTSGVGGMIRPGDRIDLYATFRKQGPQRAEGASLETYPILRNVQVLATDQNLSAKDVMAARRSASAKESYTSLTLNVSPQEVGVLLHATETGNLTAVLRNSSYPKDLSAPQKVTSENFWQLMEQAAEVRRAKLSPQEQPSDGDAGAEEAP